MKKILVGLFAVLGCGWAAAGDSINIDGVKYAVDTLQARKLGPGTDYMRLRLPGYPLNVNMLRIDVTDPHVRLETTQANDRLFGTERLADAAARRSGEGKRAIAGANGNFWCVSQSYPYSDMLLGTTFNANLCNGSIITETNCHADQWDNGPAQIGEFGIGADGLAYSGHMRWDGSAVLPGGAVVIMGANKVCRDNETVMYNSWFGSDTPFKTADMVWKDTRWGFAPVVGEATEAVLAMDPGQTWSAGNAMTFTVTAVRDNAGSGTLGANDLALVARGDKRPALQALKPGDKVTLSYTWSTLDGTPITFDNMIGGNGQVMTGGELTDICQKSENCALVYSKTGYGTSADRRTVFIIVIDKSTDPVYGVSAGCTSAVMCMIARHYGCSDMTNFDSGGSAQMYAMGTIVNRTTEGTPRAVANGMLVYAVDADDPTVTAIAFDDRQLRLPVSATVAPRILGYNAAGALVDEDFADATLTVSGDIGTVHDNTFQAAHAPGQGSLTATYNGCTVSIPVRVALAPFAFRIKDLYLEANDYPVELQAVLDGTTHRIDPAVAQLEMQDMKSDFDNDPGTASGWRLENGVLSAPMLPGSCTVTATIGEYTDTMHVHNEIAPVLYSRFEAARTQGTPWTVTRTSVKTATVTALADSTDWYRLDYTLSSPRSPKVTLSRDISVYARPESLWFIFRPDANEIQQVTLSIQAANQSRPTTVNVKPVTMNDGERRMVQVCPKDYFDTQDHAIYPLTIKNIQFVPTARSGDFSLTFGDFRGTYPLHIFAGVEEIENPDAAGGDSDASPRYYTLTGVAVERPSTPGIYIVKRGANVTKEYLK